jgi:hypothetical protein
MSIILLGSNITVYFLKLIFYSQSKFLHVKFFDQVVPARPSRKGQITGGGLFSSRRELLCSGCFWAEF